MISTNIPLYIGSYSAGSQAAFIAYFGEFPVVGGWRQALRVCANQTACWWKHWEQMHWELLLWSFRWIFSFISYTTKLLRKSHMHGYLSKKLLLNITIVLRNVLCLLIQLFALCWCSGLLWAFCDWAWELRAGRVLVWPLMEAAEENCLNWDWITYICYV